MKVLVVGDIMLDVYYYVNDMSRIAPESGLPIWDADKKDIKLGGAANTAANVASFINSDNVYLIGRGIYDTIGGQFDDLELERTPNSFLLKMRIIEKKTNKFLARIDYPFGLPEPSYGEGHEWEFFEEEEAFGCYGPFDAVIISDYEKNTVTKRMFDYLREKVPLVVVDSKRKDLSMFAGADIIKLNEHEYNVQLSQKKYLVESLCSFVVVTRGEKSTLLKSTEADFHLKPRGQGKWQPYWNKNIVNDIYTIHTIEFPVDKSDNVVDVTGCGDTFTAAMTVSLLQGNDVNRAIPFANKAAKDVVEQFGTSVTRTEK